jgi:hypothetical protein
MKHNPYFIDVSIVFHYKHRRDISNHSFIGTYFTKIIKDL